ncbi:MAG: T9SS type A sorting domain-containing protein [Ignavibacteriae bacterium]|nr:T9SS type A sorting domain-containing protein [Ignavibacteriota bacterium]
MKKILLLEFYLICTIIYPQKNAGVAEFFKINNVKLNKVNDTTEIDPYSFFPLKVSNFWQYHSQGDFIWYEIITRDSILADSSHLYYYNGSEKRTPQWPDYRIDTNYNVYYDPNDWNRLYYKLDAKIGERWWIVKFFDSDSNFIEGDIGEIDTIYQGYYLGRYTTFKVISKYLEYNNFGEIVEYWDSDRVLASGMGLIYEDKDGIQPDILISAIIDGDTIGTIVGLEEKKEIRFFDEFKLFQNYPNPFNANTKIEYTIHKHAEYNQIVYNCLGQIIYNNKKFYKPGNYQFSLDLDKYSSGVYFFQLSSPYKKQIIKMIYLK